MLDSLLNLSLAALLVGLLYAPITLGLAISFRLLNYPDLTCEGSAIIGATVCFMLIQAGAPSWISLLGAALAASIAGAFTAVAHSQLGVPKVLSGIVTTALLYSITLRLLGGKSNRMTTRSTVFDILNRGNSGRMDLVVVAGVVATLLGVLFFLYRSSLGRTLRVLGDTRWFCVSIGRSPTMYLILGLAISNAVIGLGGAMIVHFKRAVDVNMVFGLLISGLAGLVIGETIYSARSVWVHSAMCVVGSCLYNAAVGFFYFDWNPTLTKLMLPSDVRFLTGLLLIIPSVIILRFKNRYRLFGSDW